MMRIFSSYNTRVIIASGSLLIRSTSSSSSSSSSSSAPFTTTSSFVSISPLKKPSYHNQYHNYEFYSSSSTYSRMYSTSNTVFKKMTEKENNDATTKKKQQTKNKKNKNKKNNKHPNNDNEMFRAERVVSTRACLSRKEAANMIKARKVAYKEMDNTSSSSSSGSRSGSSSGNGNVNVNDDDPNSDSDSPLTPIKSTKLKIPMNAIIYINGKPLPPIPPLLLIYHKPKNVLSAMEEKHSTTKKHLGMMLPESYKKFDMHPVGRLDYDTSGLMLFSRNGDLTQRLLHPKYNIEKQYVATVVSSPEDGNGVDSDALKEKLEVNGVETSEGTHFAKLMDIQSIDVEKSQSILQKHLLCCEEQGMEQRDKRIIAAADSGDEQLFNIRLAVQEGKYRMVRRMLANCGHPVVELKRECHGVVQLNNLEVGQFRDCTEDELEWANGLL